MRLAGLPFLRGNAVELLIDGEATFESILEGIEGAEDYVLFQFFIVQDDELGREVKQHLIDAARAASGSTSSTTRSAATISPELHG